MPLKLSANPGRNNESKDEAKNPGAMLGLIMGVYPALLILSLLAAIAFVSLRGGTPGNAPQPAPSDSAAQSEETKSIENIQAEKEVP